MVFLKCSGIFFLFFLFPFDVGLFSSGQRPYLVKDNLDNDTFHFLNCKIEYKVVSWEVKRHQRWWGTCLAAGRAHNCRILLSASCCTVPCYSDESQFTDVPGNHLSAEEGTAVTTHVHVELQHTVTRAPWAGALNPLNIGLSLLQSAESQLSCLLVKPPMPLILCYCN